MEGICIIKRILIKQEQCILRRREALKLYDGHSRFDLKKKPHSYIMVRALPQELMDRLLCGVFTSRKGGAVDTDGKKEPER